MDSETEKGFANIGTVPESTGTVPGIVATDGKLFMLPTVLIVLIYLPRF